MCEVNGDYQHIASHWVTTRREHRCDGCDQVYPAGSRMKRAFGKFEGDLVHGYGCETCHWLANEEREGTALHVCWHDTISGDGKLFWAEYIHGYVRMCLEEGLEPILAVAELIERGFLQPDYEEASA